MNEYVLGMTSALWLGLLTAISPCPLATNIAAISMTSYQLSKKAVVLLSGILYGIGRSITYIAISIVIIKLALNISSLSYFLQTYINKILGIILILVGMFLLDLFKMNLPSFTPSEKWTKRLSQSGIVGTFLLGALFALAFCPISAALFFGSLIPISIRQQSAIGMPLLYGLGSAAPVLGFAVLIAVSSEYISKFYQNLTRIEYYAKRITGVVFILVGIYYILAYIFKIF
jgi:cytochrome c biogenesis protein CcdA